MTQALNTELDGDGAACREYAQWLRAFVRGANSVGDGMHRVRSESEPGWRSQAGEKLRDVLGSNSGDVDQIEEFFNREAIAMDKLAGQFDTVKSRLDQARQVAREGGLTVTAGTIEPPPEAAHAGARNGPGYDSMTDEKKAEINGVAPQDLANFEHKQRVWGEVVQTVSQARGIEAKAHDDLASALKMHKNYWEYLKPSGWAWAPVASGTYSGAYVTAQALTKKANVAQSNANRAIAGLDNAPNQAGRDQVVRQYVQEGGKAKNQTKAASSAQKLDSKIPGPDWAKKGAGYSARGVGIIGTIATAGTTVQEIKSGKPADKAVTKGVGSIGANALAGAAGVAAAGYVGGVVATGGTLLLGTALAAGVGWAVDNYYDDAKNWVSDWFD